MNWERTEGSWAAHKCKVDSSGATLAMAGRPARSRQLTAPQNMQHNGNCLAGNHASSKHVLCMMLRCKI